MSVQFNTYVMTGVVLDYDKHSSDDWYEAHSKFMDSAFKGIHHHNGLCVLFDGMNGKYVIVGRVHEKSENHIGLQTPVVVDDIPSDLSSQLNILIQELIDVRQEIDGLPIQNLVVTHYR